MQKLREFNLNFFPDRQEKVGRIVDPLAKLTRLAMMDTPDNPKIISARVGAASH